jgi:prevent-host-death family protein
MNCFLASEARDNLYRLIDQVAETHDPVIIKGKRTEAILISREDWEAIQETLYLASVPGLLESLKAIENNPQEEWTSAQDLGLL